MRQPAVSCLPCRLCASCHVARCHGRSFQLDIAVEEAGSTITWEFSTVGCLAIDRMLYHAYNSYILRDYGRYDLEFGVFWKAKDAGKLSASEMEVVHESERVSSHLCNQARLRMQRTTCNMLHVKSSHVCPPPSFEFVFCGCCWRRASWTAATGARAHSLYVVYV